MNSDRIKSFPIAPTAKSDGVRAITLKGLVSASLLASWAVTLPDLHYPDDFPPKPEVTRDMAE